MARNNETPITPSETQNEATASLPLFRVNYSYTAGINLRSGTYILPAKDSSDAKTQGAALLSERFTNTGTHWKIGKIVAF